MRKHRSSMSVRMKRQRGEMKDTEGQKEVEEVEEAEQKTVTIAEP